MGKNSNSAMARDLISQNHNIVYGQQFLPEKFNLTSFYTHNLTTTELCIFVRDLSHEKNSFATTERKKSAIKGRENNTEAFLEVKNCC